MENDLIIFEDLPSKKTPLNAYNLNHNFDVFKKQNDKTSQELENATQTLQNDITSKTQQLESNITSKTETLESEITTKANELNQNITSATEDLTQQIEQAKKELQTEIGEQIAKITTLQIEVVEELPTQDISTTTIYLIKPENLPQDLQINSITRNIVEEKLVISPLKTNDIASIAISESDFYLACFYVNQKWTVVGSTTSDLSGYVKKTELSSLETDPTVPSHVKSISEENITSWNNKAETSSIPTKMSQLTNDIFVLANNEEEALAQSAENPDKIYYWVEE